MTDPKILTDLSEATCTRVKIALAFACIRNKPPGTSAKEYAERLCANYKLHQLRWKEKYKDAESEILHLKQQLALQTDSVSLRDVNNITEDVSCFSQNLFPTPPASGNTRTRNPETSYKTSQSLSKHTAFLSHVITLKNGLNNTDERLDDLTKASILNSLELLKGCIGKNSLSWKVQMECVESIVSLIDKVDSDFQQYLAVKVGELARSVAEEILLSSAEELKDQEQRSHLLTKLASGTGTSQPVIESLLNFIFNFSEDLRGNVVNGTHVDPDYFCSMYYIINGLDQCVSQKCFTDQSDLLKQQVSNKLEDCMLHVTDRYPVFAHALWKICGKIP